MTSLEEGPTLKYASESHTLWGINLIDINTQLLKPKTNYKNRLKKPTRKNNVMYLICL